MSSQAVLLRPGEYEDAPPAQAAPASVLLRPGEYEDAAPAAPTPVVTGPVAGMNGASLPAAPKPPLPAGLQTAPARAPWTGGAYPGLHVPSGYSGPGEKPPASQPAPTDPRATPEYGASLQSFGQAGAQIAKPVIAAGQQLATGLKTVFTPTEAEVRSGASSGSRGDFTPPGAPMTPEETHIANARAIKGLADTISGGGKVGFVLGIPEMTGLAAAAAGGDTAAIASLAKIGADIGAGAVVSAAGGKAADIFHLSPEARQLITESAFWAGAGLAGLGAKFEPVKGDFGAEGVRASVPGASVEGGYRPAYRAPNPATGDYGEGSTVEPGKAYVRGQVGKTQFGGSPETASAAPTGSPKEIGSGAPPMGETEPETGRPVLHQSPRAEVNQAAATAEHPAVKDALAALVKPIAGAEISGAREEKDPERRDEKIDEGQSPRTVRDYSGYRIAVDTPAARDKVVAELKKNFEVHGEQDNFESGDEEHSFHAHTLNIQEPGSPVSHEVQVLPREVAEAADEDHGLYEKARAGNAGAAKELAEKNQANWQAFIQRQEESQKAGKPEIADVQTSQAEPKYEFGSTQHNIAPESEAGRALLAAGKKIDPADLQPTGFGGNEKGIEPDPHVTVRYGIQGDDTSRIEKYLRSQAPFEATLGKSSAFPPSKGSDGGAVIKADVDAPELHRMNAEIAKHGDFKESDFPEYKPHATIAYVKPEAAGKYVGMNDMDGKKFTVDHVNISDRDGNLKRIALEGKKPAQPAGASAAADVRAPRPPAGRVADAARPAAKPSGPVRAPKPPAAAEPRFKAGDQSTPVLVRTDGKWVPGTLNHLTEPAFEPRRARVSLADGSRVLRNVALRDLRPAEDDAMTTGAAGGVTSGVAGKERPSKGAIAVDMDNTIATYDGWKGPQEIGKPIAAEVAKVKQMLAEGKDVWIYTARAEHPEAIPAIKAWTREHIGQELPVTNVKYPEFAKFVDDRAVLPAHVAEEQNAGASGGGNGGADAAEGASGRDIQGDREGRGAAGEREAAGDAGGDKPAAAVRREPVDEEAARALKRKQDAPAALARSVMGNAEAHRSGVVELAGRRHLLLDTDGEGLWQRIFADVKKMGGQHPLGAGASWRGMTLSRDGVNLAIAHLTGKIKEAKALGLPGEGAVRGLERLVQGLKDARGEGGAVSLLRGDYNASTPREEALHQWQRENGLNRSYAMAELARQPEFEDIATRLRAGGYQNADPHTVAMELMAKAMAGDASFVLTDAQRESLVRSFVTEAVDEKGSEILRTLPETDPRVRGVIEDVRRESGDGGQLERRGEGNGEQEVRRDPGEGIEGVRTEDRGRDGVVRGQEERGPIQNRERRVPEERPAEGKLKAPRPPDRKLALDKKQTTGSDEPVFQRQKEDETDEAPDWLREAQGLGMSDPRDRPGLPARQEVLPFGGKPVWQRALGAFRDWRDETPDAGSDLREMLRDHRGQMDRQVLQLKHELRDVRKEFVGKGRDEVTHFIDAIESGKLERLDARHRDIAQGLSGVLAEDRHELQQLDPDKLKNFYENYFPHIWDRSGKVARQMQAMSGQKPFHGSGSFLQHRTLYPPTFAEGIKIGLEPKTWNPVDMALMKHAEIQRYIFGLRTVQQMKRMGLTKLFNSPKEAPPDWVQLDDRFATVMHTNDAGERVLDGHYYAPALAARDFNRFVSRGLQGRHEAIDTAFALNNAMNALQLGLSAFHATASVLHTSVSDIALGLKELTQGRVADAGKHIGRGLLPGASAVRAMRAGDSVMKEYLDPGSAAQYEAEAEWVARSGGRPEQSVRLEPGAMQQVSEAIRQGDWGRTAKGALPAVIDAAGGWLMHGVIPRLKLGVFQDMAANILKESRVPNPGGDGGDMERLSDEEVRSRMQKAWDSVDNRFGQMVYDNLFWNRSVLDASRLGVRSVGWNLGSAREFGGAMSDTLKAFARAASGRRPEVSDRTAFTLALPIFTAMAASAMTYLMTGHGPDTTKYGMKAYFFPEKADGTLMSLPGYIKDWFSTAQHPVDTVLHKSGPLVSTMASMMQNEDYYGNKIRNEDDPAVQQAWDATKYVARQSLPFSIESFQQQRKNAGGGELADVGKKQSGLMTALSYAGFQPASKEIQNSAAMNLAEHYRQESPEAPRTREQAEKSELRRNLVKALQAGNLNDEKLQKAVVDGRITTRMYREAVREANETPIERLAKGLSLPQLMNVWKKATPDERAALQELIARKATDAYKTDPASVEPMTDELNTILAAR